LNEDIRDYPKARTSRISVPSPLYIQIAESLLDRIESGELSPGTRLPPERELSKSFGVTRATVREALKVLEERGLLSRRQGQGTFVATPKIERQASKLVPFTKGMERRGYKAEIRLITLEKIPAEAPMAAELDILVGESIYFIHRLRLINNEPVLIERLFVPEARFSGLERYDLAHRSLYEVMEVEYGIEVARARQSLEPVSATDYEAELLGIKPRSPLMLERRLTFDQYDRPVERARDLFRGDRFRFVTELAPLEI
jgi:GntR family transcriptional regulator